MVRKEGIRGNVGRWRCGNLTPAYSNRLPGDVRYSRKFKGFPKTGSDPPADIAGYSALMSAPSLPTLSI